jgi:5'-AMP-activated protein kinase catalytic alpha subunit
MNMKLTVLVVLYAMLYGTVPFKAANMSGLHEIIRKAKFHLTNDISEEAKSLIKGLLDPNPKTRLTIREVF